MSVYAYDPHTGTSVTLSAPGAVIVAEKDPDPVPVGTFADLCYEEYIEFAPSRRQLFRTALTQVLPQRTWLHYVEYDEHLNQDELDDLFYGRHQWLEDSIQVSLEDRREQSLRETLQEALAQLGTELEVSELTEEDRWFFSDLIKSRDRSNPLAEMIEHTPRMFLRYQLSAVGPEVGSDPQHKRALLNTALAKHGVDVEQADVAQMVEQILEESRQNWHEYFSFDVIVYEKPGPLAPDETVRTLSLTNPELVLIDPVNGTGFDTTLPAELTLKLDPAETVADGVSDRHFFPDDRGGLHVQGYGWNECAGLGPITTTIDQINPPLNQPNEALRLLTASRRSGSGCIRIEDPVQRLGL